MTDNGTAALAAALAKVQAELPDIERDRTVEVEKKAGGTYSYSYVTLANLSKAVLPLLARNGLSYAALPGAGADGKMCLRYHLLHESGETLSGEFPISGEGGIQMVGGRITYARRYCLAALVGVAADEDDESRLGDDSGRGTAQRARPRQQEQQKQPSGRTAQRGRTSSPPPLPNEDDTDRHRKRMHALFTQHGMTTHEDRVAFAARAVGRELQSTNDLSNEEKQVVIQWLERGPTEQGDSDPSDDVPEVAFPENETEANQ